MHPATGLYRSWSGRCLDSAEWAQMSRIFARRRCLVIAALLASALVAAACGSGGKPAMPPPGSSRLISSNRCAQNKAAGKITFLTSFDYAASVGILDVLAADEVGYF